MTNIVISMVRYDLNLFEVWKPIPGYEGLYEVSSEGRVWSIKRKQFKSISVNKKTGYAYVTLCKEMKSNPLLLHRVVLNSFIDNPNPDIYTDVNHKNENKTDNRLVNLEWCDRRYNILYGTGLQRRVDKTRETNVHNGRWNKENFGLSKSEYNRKYHTEHREELLLKMKEYKIKKKAYELQRESR